MSYKWINRKEDIKSVEDFARISLKNWEINITLEEVYEMYNLPHRYFHNVKEHLLPVMCNLYDSNYMYIDDKILEQLFIVALFHDIIYEPKNTNNEEESVNYLLTKIPNINKDYGKIIQAILDTKTHKILEKSITKENMISHIFCKTDLYGMTFGKLEDLIITERLIAKEYQYARYDIYKKNRIKFIKNYMALYNIINGDSLISYIKAFIPKIGIYTGSNIETILKSEKIFDKVIIIDNEELDKIYFSNREIVKYDGYIEDFIKEQEKYANITLIKDSIIKENNVIYI